MIYFVYFIYVVYILLGSRTCLVTREGKINYYKCICTEWFDGMRLVTILY